jgi:TPR repeat protein
VSAGTDLNAALAEEAAAYRALLAGSDASAHLIAARDAYLASHAQVGDRSWGRMLGALKMAILASDGVEQIARRAIAEAGDAQTPASAYVAALARVAVGETPELGVMRDSGETFARMARALDALDRHDATDYAEALGAILRDFESRDEYVSGVAYADTVAVLERLADLRGISAHPTSDILRA